MNLRLGFLALLKIGAAILFAHTHALADSPAWPYDYRVATENGQFVFVMLAPERRRGARDLEEDKDPEIRAAYKQSGLYPVGSHTPLWIVDWYSFEVIPSSDGKHLVQMGPWASKTKQLAVAFHREGKEIRRYLIRELVWSEWALVRTVSHFFWRADVRYDDKRAELFLKTVDGLQYRFSVSTGRMLDRNYGPNAPSEPHRWKASGIRGYTR